jgi:error-prone DNA polymerase
MQTRDGRRIETAGLVLVRQRPGSAKGVMFITLEDETGIVNVVVWPKVFEQFRRAVMAASMIAVRGHVQREGEVVHLVAQKLVDLSAELATVGAATRPFPRRVAAGIRSPTRAADPTRAKCRRGAAARTMAAPTGPSTRSM